MGKELLINAVHAAGYSMAPVEDANAFADRRQPPDDAPPVAAPLTETSEPKPQVDWFGWLGGWFVRSPHRV